MSVARTKRGQLATAGLRDAAPLFAALGDRTRLRLLARLARGPHSITRLSERADISRQAITKHLAVLMRAGLVRDTRLGRERHFELERARLDAARAYVERIGRQWDGALARLKAHVEG
ncbi:MAG: winged helix-turn-helix transcriptional regulator [Planctomycetes bacterium]|nr:winged helix-turn-helix transcriptional regulator [Planctomycetota bacterium]